jgi:hypothetical protein
MRTKVDAARDYCVNNTKDVHQASAANGLSSWYAIVGDVVDCDDLSCAPHGDLAGRTFVEFWGANGKLDEQPVAH